MENKKTHRAILLEALKKTRDQAMREYKALELEYLIAREGKVFKVLPSGEEIYLKEAEFGITKSEKKQFVLQ